MTPQKKDKRPKIAKRKSGLVIEPPAPRSVTSDDPSLAIFKEAKAAELSIQHSSNAAVPQYRSTAVRRVQP